MSGIEGRMRVVGVCLKMGGLSRVREGRVLVRKADNEACMGGIDGKYGVWGLCGVLNPDRLDRETWRRPAVLLPRFKPRFTNRC